LNERDHIDAEIDAIADMGDKRLTSQNRSGFEILPVKEVCWRGKETVFLHSQVAAFGPGLDMHYLELLRRAKRLVDHLDANVGEDEEWPILLLDADEQHYKLVDELRSMVGCLTEI
jgi:hypothetical protein